MIRPLNPLDLAALISFAGSAPNEAAPRESLTPTGPGPSVGWTGALLRQWLAPGGKRQALGCVEGGRVKGLTSMRERSGPGVWEVDGLYVSSEEGRACSELLDAAGSAVSRVKGERLFLRLRDTSTCLASARTAGFVRYQCETLYQFPAERTPLEASADLLQVRRRLPGDEHALFRLCLSSAPEAARNAQGLTFELWRGSQERTYRHELVWDEAGEVQGWLRVCVFKDSGCFDLVVGPAAQPQAVRHLLEHGVRLLQDKPKVFCLVTEHQALAHETIRDRGATETAGFSALVRQLALRETEPSLMPSRA